MSPSVNRFTRNMSTTPKPKKSVPPKRMEFRATAGSKGGTAAAAAMTAAERKARGQKAIAARWGKKGK